MLIFCVINNPITLYSIILERHYCHFTTLYIQFWTTKPVKIYNCYFFSLP